MEYPDYYKAMKRKYRYKCKNLEAKDKAWAFLSDYTRVRDFARYGVCVSCHKPFGHWKESQGGHYVPMGAGGTSSGFFDLNIHGQCMHCNKFGEMEAGGNFRQELVKRYGEDIFDIINEQKIKTVKADEQFFVKKIEEIYARFQELREEYPNEEYPAYID